MLNESASLVCDQLGRRSIIWINPQHVQFQIIKQRPIHHRWLMQASARCHRVDPGSIFKKTVRRILRTRFFLSDNDKFIPVPIENLDMFRLVQDYTGKHEQLDETIWYRNFMNSIKTHGCARHDDIVMRNAPDVRRFFKDHVEPLRITMSTRGYDMARTSETGRCYIWSDGELHKGAHARHRLMFAKVLGVERIPLQVYGIHQSWFAQRFDRFDLDGIERAIEAVEARFR